MNNLLMRKILLLLLLTSASSYVNAMSAEEKSRYEGTSSEQMLKQMEDEAALQQKRAEDAEKIKATMREAPEYKAMQARKALNQLLLNEAKSGKAVKVAQLLRDGADPEYRDQFTDESVHDVAKTLVIKELIKNAIASKKATK